MLSHSKGGARRRPSPLPEVPLAVWVLGTLTLHTQTAVWEDTPFTHGLLEKTSGRTRPEKSKEKEKEEEKKGKERKGKEKEDKEKHKKQERKAWILLALVHTYTHTPVSKALDYFLPTTFLSKIFSVHDPWNNLVQFYYAVRTPKGEAKETKPNLSFKAILKWSHVSLSPQGVLVIGDQ